MNNLTNKVNQANQGTQKTTTTSNKSFSFKSVVTPFGKMWGYNNIITVQILPQEESEEVKSLSKASKLGHDEFIEAMKASTKEYFKKVSYQITNPAECANAKTVLEALPKQLVKDLADASKLGMKKTYNLHFLKGEKGNVYVILEAQRFIPKANGGFTTPQAKPTGSNEVIFSNIGRENSTVTVLPRK